MSLQKLKTILLGLILGGSIGFATLPANAAVHESLEYTYYSDATHSRIVGFEFSSCGTMVTRDGIQTAYYSLKKTVCGPTTPSNCFFSWNVLSCFLRPT